MNKKLKAWGAAGAVFAAAAGPLLHFAFAWSGNNALVGVVSAVNESVWEHMKLLAMPVLFFTALQFAVVGRHCPNFPAARGISILAGLAVIPLLFYGYTAVLGGNVMWVDIALFFLADFFLFWLDSMLLRQGRLASNGWRKAGAALLLGILFLFIWFTFRPPHLGLWRDSVTGGYGIP